LGVAVAGGLLAAASPRPAAGAVAYSFRCYGPSQGLGQSQARALAQDRDGYLWIGTFGGGLDRFDGRKFDNFARPRLSSNQVSGIATDSGGAVWVATPEGLTRLEHGASRTFEERDGLPSREVNAVYADPQGGVWAATAKGAARWSDGRFVASRVLAGDREPAVQRVARGADGELYLATAAGLFRQSGGTWRRLIDEPQLDVVAIGREVWALGLTHLWRVRGDEAVADREVPAKAGAPLWLRLAPDRAGQLWVAGHGGASRLTGAPLHLGMDEGVQASNVSDLLFDRDGGLWLATEGAGVCQLPNLALSHLGTGQGLPGESVFQIGRVGDELWIATDGGIGAVDGDGAGLVRRIHPGLTAWRFLAPSAAGDSWFSGGPRLVRFAGQAMTSFGRETLPSQSAVLARDPEGRPFVGTMANGTWRWRDGRLEPLRGGPASVLGFILDAHGALWAYGRSGIGRVEGDAVVAPPELDASLAAASITYAALAPDGVLWLATDGGGVGRLDPARPSVAFPALTIADGLSDDTTYVVHFDRRGDLWVGTRRGLDRLDGASLHRGATRLRHYGGRDGVFGVETNSATFEDSNGDLWFGSIAGVVRFRPSEEAGAAAPPVPRLREASLGGAEAALPLPAHGLVLDHDQRDVRFVFEAPALRGEEWSYQFRFHPGDPWSSGGPGGVAQLPVLPSAGEYRLEARVCRGTECGAASAPVAFTVLGAWWQQPWFLVLAAMALGTAVTLGHRARLRGLERGRRQAQLESALADAQLASLRQQIQPHFLFNTLNMISALVRDRRTQEAVEMLAGAGELLRYSLATASRQKVRLSEELKCAEIYLAIQGRRFSDRLRAVVEIEPAALGAAVPSFSLQPLLENAVTHGMDGSRGPVRVELRARTVAGRRLIVEVLDDGRRTATAPITKHVGLGSLEARLARLYGGASLTLEPRPQGGFSARIDIPLESVAETAPERDAPAAGEDAVA
jgi:ligand-binding sensor domain-containing protein